MNGIIYLAKNRTNSKVYVGLTTRSLPQRKAEHNKRSKKSHDRFPNAIRKYGINGFDWCVVDTFTTLSDGIEKEKKFISQFQSHLSENGYNHLDGGYGRHGPMSDKTKQQMSQSHMGMKHTEESRRNISNALAGKVPSTHCLEKLKDTFTKKRDEIISRIVSCVEQNPHFNGLEVSQATSICPQTLYNYINRGLIKDWR